VANGVDALTVVPDAGGATTVIFVVLPVTVDPKTPRAEQDFGEFRMQFVGPGF
jgi:hypothetical protein